jgi:hypothetical protein
VFANLVRSLARSLTIESATKGPFTVVKNIGAYMTLCIIPCLQNQHLLLIPATMPKIGLSIGQQILVAFCPPNNTLENWGTLTLGCILPPIESLG